MNTIMETLGVIRDIVEEQKVNFPPNDHRAPYLEKENEKPEKPGKLEPGEPTDKDGDEYLPGTSRNKILTKTSQSAQIIADKLDEAAKLLFMLEKNIKKLDHDPNGDLEEIKRVLKSQSVFLNIKKWSSTIEGWSVELKKMLNHDDKKHNDKYGQAPDYSGINDK